MIHTITPQRKNDQEPFEEAAPSQAAPAVAREQVAAGALVVAAATMAGTSLQNRF